MRAQAKHSSAKRDGSVQRCAAFGRCNRFARPALLTIAALFLLAYFAAPASAVLVRPYQSSFGSPLSNPQSIAVDQSGTGAGDVYVVDLSEPGTIKKFDSAGNPEDFSALGTNTLDGSGTPAGLFAFFANGAQVAIDSSGNPATDGDIYVSDPFNFTVQVFDASGTYQGSLGFGLSTGVAVGPDGRVYVGMNAGVVNRYVPSGGPVTEADFDAQMTGLPGAQGALAVDSAGSVYVTTRSTGPLTKYTAAQFGAASPSGTVVDATSRAVAVDPTTDNVYVDEGDGIAVFSSAGDFRFRFGSSAEFGTESVGIGVKGSGGNAYVADPATGEIDLFGPEDDVPLATTQSATNITKVKATLHGLVDPGDDPGIDDCYFEWGTSVAYGNTAPCAEGTSFSEPTPVSAALTGLTPGETYHFRLQISTTAQGEFTGADESFQAVAVPPQRFQLAAFGPDGTGASFFSRNRQLAYNQANDRLYVLNPGENPFSDPSLIYGFEVSSSARTPLGGAFPISTIGSSSNFADIAVDSTALASAGNIYLVRGMNRTSIYGFDFTGAALGGNFPVPATGPSENCGVAVDSTGAFWVGTFAGAVDKYDSAGNPIESVVTIESEVGGSTCNIAFDSNDDMYVKSAFTEALGWRVWKLTAPSYSTATAKLIDPGASMGASSQVKGIAVDTSDHHLFVAYNDKVREYDATGVLLREFATGIPGADFRGIAVDSTNHHVYVSDAGNNKIREFSPAVIAPDVTTGSGSPLSATSAMLDGVLSSNNIPLTDCRFEYVSEAEFLVSGFEDLSSGGSVPCTPAHDSIPVDFEDHAVTGTATGLDPATSYRFRLVAANADITAPALDNFVPGQPLVETTGSPTRSATTARLDARVYPHGTDTTYHFEYGDQGPCDSNPCIATAPHPVGSGDIWKLVSQQITGLVPNTTYHYRVLADNGNPDGSTAGEDLAFTTRSTAQLTHGDLPGPPGSDRAWELVNAPDTGGNPIAAASAISTNGNRVVYQMKGGGPDSDTGTLLSQLFAERTATGWRSRRLFPTRDQATGNLWNFPAGRDDLSELVSVNSNTNGTGNSEIWRISADDPAQHIWEIPSSSWNNSLVVSDDASRVVTLLQGSLDPDHPVAGEETHLYDVSDGAPRLVGLLPDGSVPACGSSGLPLNPDQRLRYPHLVSANGDLVFFSASDCSSPGFYVRDIEAGETKSIFSGTGGSFIRSTEDAAFFSTISPLASEDTGGKDVYRYDLGNESLDCVTCVLPGLDVEVGAVAIPDDGSRIYFNSPKRLLPGAAAGGIYRVDLATDALDYIATGASVAASTSQSNAIRAKEGNAITVDGSVIVFRSDSSTLNSPGGPDNAGTFQYYRYDDRDRSLVCVSCPLDGSSPRGSVRLGLLDENTQQLGPNLTPVSDSGDFAFATPTSLVSADQNTASSSQEPFVGTDIYEWRDGRLLLVTDGISSSIGLEDSSESPEVSGVTPSGRDIFFTQPARLTPNAIDAYNRLYTARIGGGIEFPPPPPPCPLEVCQGTPKGAPEDDTPASRAFTGRGNVQEAPQRKRCGKGKRKVRRAGKVRCVRRTSNRANHNRRTAR